MIRRAKSDEYSVLTEISFSSKKYWGYPDEYYAIWEKELTITRDYIDRNDVYVHELDGSITGYYSMIELKEDIMVSNVRIEAGNRLEHMFIFPELIRKGIGRRLFLHCIEMCREKATDRIRILADPFARGFYERMGCAFIKEYPSTIEGRTTPCLEYDLSN